MSNLIMKFMILKSRYSSFCPLSLMIHEIHDNHEIYGIWIHEIEQKQNQNIHVRTGTIIYFGLIWGQKLLIPDRYIYPFKTIFLNRKSRI